jgi:hypothetical protein
MLRALHNRIHGPGSPASRTVESALWAAGLLTATILVIMILFLGVFVTRAT